MFGSKEPRVKRSRTAGLMEDSPDAPQEKISERGPIAVFRPTSYQDVAVMIDSLKSGKPALVHLTALKPETALRIIDMLSGAVYALGGGVYEMEENIFMYSPSGVEMK